MPELLTIGVYGYDEAGFFQALQQAGVDTFCDLRARRGVRGAAYAFANSQRLQQRLAELGIRYLHLPDLAPSPTLRQTQAAADKAEKIGRRQRTLLSPAFIAGYTRQVLAPFDTGAFFAALPAGAQVIALFCVERDPAACHRSLLAARIAQDAALPLRHLLP
ncbi:MAG: DUF488 domain-containing protein [Caldilineales bacterium]|nr:DUF488 domain-containing protein [Caldilineales bacterium]